jgi:predicted nuclease of restriction endonuclease-like RecB superfamily
MLTTDHVLARRRGDELVLRGLRGDQASRAAQLAAAYLDAARTSVGETRAAFEARCAAVDADPRDRRIAAGLRKLVADRCRFATADDVDPAALRRELFTAAAAVRRELGAAEELDRGALVADTAHRLGMQPSTLEDLLFCDLKGAHRLQELAPVTPDALLQEWTLGQVQAVLLKAVHVHVEVKSDRAAAYRALFGRLKFHRLLFRLHPLEGGGYGIDIDGPFSLFRSVTKYGLQLALLPPVLSENAAWRLRAEVLWGRDRRRLRFEAAGGPRDATPHDATSRDAAPRAPQLDDELAAFAHRFAKLHSGWQVAPSTRILHLPGVGLCVADLEFTHADSGEVVLLEQLGFWSRDAVWRRVDLVEAGLPDPIVFAVSDRLRVSEAALDDDAPACLYVYRGQLAPRAVLERLERLRARRRPSARS